MSVIDIVNRDVVNLSNCESEPIHIPGSIQPHGFLLGISTSGHFIIDYCSANSTDYLKIAPDQLLGKPLSHFFPETELQAFNAYVGMLSDASQPFVFSIESVPYSTTVHASNQTLVLEFEPFPDGSMNLPDLYNQTRNFVSFIEGTNTLTELCQDVAEETRRLTGYDRVMIYRFDKDYNGEVIAESKREDLTAFLGLNYPHTDIPAQARELYLRNLMRTIVDVGYQPIPILTLEQNFEQKKHLDLSLSVLRSVSPMHIEYLKNMGVQGTMSISLIRNKKLWGLIACHHYSPKNIPHYTRLAAKLQGHFLTSQIDVRQVVEEYSLNQQIENGLIQLQKQLNEEHFYLKNLVQQKMLSSFIGAEGVAILNNGELFTQGLVPATTEIHQLAEWLFQKTDNGYIYSSRLAEIYPYAERISETAAGIVYYGLGKSFNDCIIWFRPEVEKTINWAGNPDKAVTRDLTTEKLSPRKSFALWKQSVKLQSQEWKAPELLGASKMAAALQKQFHFISLSREEAKMRKLSEKLKKANEELESMNWVSAHDLKEPLRKIQIFSSKIMEQGKYDLPADVTESVRRMHLAAQRMRQLLDDILASSLMSNKEESFTPVNLNELLDATITTLEEEIASKKAIIEHDVLPVINGISFQIKQLFTNLIHNALKFSKQDLHPQIRITSELLPADNTAHESLKKEITYYKIVISDNGIGFENEYATKIMTIFQRLHTNAQYPGTGIGLAICKKVMDNHEGFIEAQGELQKGATFTLYFPA